MAEAIIATTAEPATTDPAADLFDKHKLITTDEWERFQSLESAFARLANSKDAELAEARQATVAVETRAKRSALVAELAAALSDGPSLIPGGAAQIIKLTCDDFVVEADGDGWRVTTRDGLSPAEFLRSKIDGELSHFVQARARGGAGGSGDAATPTRPNQGRGNPGSLEAIASRWKSEQQSYGASGVYSRSLNKT